MLSAYRCPYNICQFFSQTILTFKNNVRKASHAFPEQYTSLKTDRDYFSEFKHSVKTIEKRLYGEIFMTAFEHSKPFLFYNDRGFINTLTYPAVLFPAECLRITHELIGKYFYLKIISFSIFMIKGFVFRYHLLNFYRELILSNTQKPLHSFISFFEIDVNLV